MKIGSANITFKLRDKPVKGLPWDTEVEFTYFIADMLVDGEKVSQSTIWCRDPQDAINSAINALSDKIKSDAPSGFARYGDRIKPVRGKYNSFNYRGYWVLEGQTTEETKQ